jgi:hypothetical protein
LEGDRRVATGASKVTLGGLGVPTRVSTQIRVVAVRGQSACQDRILAFVRPFENDRWPCAKGLGTNIALLEHAIVQTSATEITPNHRRKPALPPKPPRLECAPKCAIGKVGALTAHGLG